ncbi:MAG: hypothetical protein LWX83_03795 [Anaerolineae bacterium]|nr:hypothetical protein [Anaerolineae bacterium]
MVRRPQNKPAVTYVRRPRRRRSADILNLLSTLVVSLSLCLLVWFVYLFNNPGSRLNPMPPVLPSLPPTIAIPTAAAAEATLVETEPPTETPQPPATPSGSVGPLPPTLQITLPGPSPTPLFDPASPTETDLPRSYYSYAIISAPNAIEASTLKPDRDCNWMGVGGNVFDMQNRPATGILVQMGGYLNGEVLLEYSLTGTVLHYGPAGYEFTLAEKPTATRKALWIRLVDQAKQPISEKVVFDTYPECARNLILVNFKQIK